MADYIYLLENRLSQAQRKAIEAVREIARIKGLTVFLVGGAVRDLTSGSPVRDLDVAVQGNALKLKKDLEKTGAVVTGELEAMQAVFVRFPGNVRMEVGSTLAVQFPKPGKPVVKAANILEDLRRRDFTANAMALSLNEGSYGLLMDPLNGVADIENRELRLVSNYGFIEDPVRMVRGARLAARLGWQMEEKTQARYVTGKTEGYISAMSEFQRGYELEEIVHEEDPLRVMRRLESEGWLKLLAPGWTPAKANVAELDKLREAQMQLQMQGIHADASAAQFPLLTAKLGSAEVKALKKAFPRKGFVEEIDALEVEAKKFAAELGSKQAASPSGAWKLLMAAKPEAVLWVAYSTKNAGLQAKFKSFYSEWPQARQKVPYVLMQEMRIVPDLPGYDALVERLFFELMDGKLGTVEEMKAYLEPYSPPAPPPPVSLRRARTAKKEAKAKSRKKAGAAETPDTDEQKLVAEVVAALGEGALEQHMGAGEVMAVKPAAPAKTVPAAKASTPAKVAAKAAAPAKAPAKTTAKATPVKAVAVKPATKAAPAKKAASVKGPAKKPVAPAKKAAPVKSGAKKSPVKIAGKSASKGPSGPSKQASSKQGPAKPAAKPAPKSASKKKENGGEKKSGKGGKKR